MKLDSKFAAYTALASFVLTAAVVVSFVPAAQAASYSTSGFSLGGLGDKLGTGYDYLTGSSISGVNFVDGQIVTLNDLSFTAGINAVDPAIYTNFYSINETITINGGTAQAIQIPFNLSINYSDTVSILPTTMSFVDGGSTWQVAVNGLTLGPNSGGTMLYSLTAQITDPPPQAPLPAALPLFASGLGGMGLFAVWRKRKSGAKTAA